MTDYITTLDLRAYIGSATTNFDTVAQDACTSASRMIETMCERVFTTASTATTRYYMPTDHYCVDVDDFYTTDGLIVATNDGAVYGAYDTPWTIGDDFRPYPINGRSGAIDVPYNALLAVGGKYFWRYIFETVSVTAKWGWAAVPAPVRQATLMAAAQLFKLKDAPDGFVGLDGWGPARVRENPAIRTTLGPYMRHPIAVG